MAYLQISPKVLFTADGYRYNGKTLPVYPKLVELLASLPTVTHVITVGHLHLDRVPREPAPTNIGGRTWKNYVDAVREGEGAPKEIKFWRGPAMSPVFVLYSSGTTGKPKAIVHSIGGMILSKKMVK